MLKIVLAIVCLMICAPSCRRANLEDIESPQVRQPISNSGQPNVVDSNNTGNSSNGIGVTGSQNDANNPPATVNLPPAVVIPDYVKIFDFVKDDSSLGKVKELIEQGKVDIAVVNNDKQTLLHIAAMDGQFAISQYLYEKENGLSMIKDSFEKLPFDYVIEKLNVIDKSQPDLVEAYQRINKLLSGVEIRPEDFIPEFFDILEKGDAEIGLTRLQELIELGIDANLTDSRELKDDAGNVVQVDPLPVLFLALSLERQADTRNPLKFNGLGQMIFPYAELLVDAGADLRFEIKYRGRDMNALEFYKAATRNRTEEKWINILTPAGVAGE